MWSESFWLWRNEQHFSLPTFDSIISSEPDPELFYRRFQLLVVHASSHIHSGKVVGVQCHCLFGRLMLRWFQDFHISKLLFCSSFSFSHLLVYNLLSQELHFIIHFSYSCLLLLLLSSGRRVHCGHNVISLQCHKHHWLLESKSTLMGEKLKDGSLLL